jgi:hypothetical protein
VEPKRINHDDLLGDARFWALLHESCVKPRVGDAFKDGEQYFFGVGEQDVQEFFSELQSQQVGKDTYPEFSVLLSLRNRWRVGVTLSMWPDDFQVQVIIEAPSSNEHVVFGVDGGNSRLPALRWEELFIIRDSVIPPESVQKARAVLLLFPFVCLSDDTNLNDVQRILENCWQECGIFPPHANELVARDLEDEVHVRNVRRKYPDMPKIVWSKDPKYGWINNSAHSFRNPNVTGSSDVLPSVQRFFSEL